MLNFLAKLQSMFRAEFWAGFRDVFEAANWRTNAAGRPQAGGFAAVFWLAICLAVGAGASAHAQDAAGDQAGEGGQRLVLRFVTESNFPPFNFYDEDGILTGFNVDLARAICLELNATCDIKVRNWPELFPALARKEADASIAAHAVTAQGLRKVDFTDSYFHTPGRFAARREANDLTATPEGLEGKRIGVATGTTHEAFVRQFFRASRVTVFTDVDASREALRDGKIDIVFDDAISLAFWLNGTLSQQCCAFVGGAYLEPTYFGNGIAIAVAKNESKLRADINDAIKATRDSGRFQELVARYFPFRLY